ncbi:two-component system histidine kinase PnpS [Hydrogenibacillus schlegelii]|uniref:histidine kinase n=2 Tax=Hydrogenibacillus schlegelii TaxID=1484 RepID=A0A2T5GCD5_HYDSH|nr:HAMP domain-containing sensor histidine kinase [Hydrogenibacillus schlegelii]PTQ53863.1 MAG: Phosphate regulon sensor protein PhoR (SphS) [Hydrogenibacillus schlegelii]
MQSLRLRLTAYVLGVVLVAFAVFFLYEALVVGRAFEREARRHGEALAAALAEALEGRTPAEAEALLPRLAAAAGVRIALEGAGGRPLAVFGAPSDEGALSFRRPVVLAGPAGAPVTLVVTEAAGRRDDLFSGPWGPGLLGGMVLLGLLSLFVYRVATEVTRPVTQVAEVARLISDEHYGVTVDVRGYGEIAELTAAINAMSRSLALQMKRIRDDEKRFGDILMNMTSGVVLLDARGRVVFVNRAAEGLLHLAHRPTVGRHHVEAFRHFELSELVERVLETKAAARRELQLYFPEERVLDAHLVPLFDDDGRLDALLLVVHDITDIRRLERIRSEFVMNASHELKTPVTSIQGFAETLLDGALESPEAARRFVEIIYNESERLKRLIQDILDLSRIEQRRLPLDFRPVRVKALVDDVLLTVQKEAEKKRIALSADVDPALQIESDYDRLKQIMLNLVVNAIQYTPEDGRAVVRAVDEGATVVLSVEDNGIGIPRRDLDRIFERFYRVDKARSRHSGGTGLGLSIVRHLVELLGGMIWVESTEGVGSTFFVRLPKVRDAEETPPPRDEGGGPRGDDGRRPPAAGGGTLRTDPDG